MKTQWDRVGYRFTDRCVVLRGGYIIGSAKNGVYWKKTLGGRWLLMSSHHMTEETLPAYIDRIRRFKPRFIQGYPPSTAVILARYMREHGIEPISTVKAVLCGSENLYPWQRDLLTEVFGCRVFSWYGNSEQTVLAGECEESTHYHIFPEYGIVELIGRDGRPVRGGPGGRWARWSRPTSPTSSAPSSATAPWTLPRRPEGGPVPAAVPTDTRARGRKGSGLHCDGQRRTPLRDRHEHRYRCVRQR